jgi:hypothetical protein
MRFNKCDQVINKGIDTGIGLFLCQKCQGEFKLQMEDLVKTA